MRVLEVGLVDEYNSDGKYDYSKHVEAQLLVLEQLKPDAAVPLRARFNVLRDRRYAAQDHINKVAGDISEALAKCAPKGMYYGIPRINSNMAGFWPDTWLRPEGKPDVIGPIDAEVRKFGACVIG